MSTTESQNLEKEYDYVKEAFFQPINLAVLLTASLIALLLKDSPHISNPLLSFCFGGELLYLGIVPRLPNFKKLIKMRKAQTLTKGSKDKILFQKLAVSYQKRFLAMRHYMKLVEENFKKMPYTSQGLLDSIHNKLEDLMSTFLQHLEAIQMYDQYIKLNDDKTLKAKIEAEKKELDALTSERLILTKKRKLVILKKRLDRYTVAKENFLLSQSNLDTIEEAVRYIYEQSMTMDNPEEIGFKLDNLLLEVEETSNLISSMDNDMLDSELADFELDNDLNDANTANSADAAKSSPNPDKVS